MQFKSLIIAALAATVAAERTAAPYLLSRKSPSLVALAAREEPGYKPEQTFCGEGDTCAEACGAGYEQCPSTDDFSHCYDKSAGESCCTDDNGNACENGYYCAADTTGSTWCCPEGMTADECAKEYDVTGGLSSQIPSATGTTTTATSPSSSLSLSTSGSSSTIISMPGNSTSDNSTYAATQKSSSPTSSAGSTTSTDTSSDESIGTNGVASFAASSVFAAFFALAAALL